MKPTGGLAREAGQAVRWNAAAAAATLLSQFLQIVFLARWLSPAEFGIAAVAISVAGFLQGFCDLGLTNALVQRESVSKSGWSSAWWATAAVGALLCLALAVCARPLEGVLRLAGLAPLLVAVSLTLPGFGPASVFQAHLQRHLHFRRLAVAEILAAGVSLAVTLGWAYAHRNGGALVAGQVALVVARLAALGAVSTLRFSWTLRWGELVPLSAFGGYQMGERALSYAASNLDRVLIARLLGPAATGYYAMASQIALRPAALLGPFIGRTLLPLLARLQGERARLAAAYLRSLSALGFVSAFVYSLLFGLAHPLVKLALGPGWEPAILTLRILALLGFLTVLGNALGSLTLATGRARTGFWLNFIVLAGRMAGVFLGARYGLTGAAVAVTLVTVISLPFDVWLPHRWVGIRPSEIALAGGWAILPGLLTAAGVAWAGAMLPLSAWMEVVMMGLLGMLCFGGLAWILHRRRLSEALQEMTSKLR